MDNPFDFLFVKEEIVEEEKEQKIKPFDFIISIDNKNYIYKDGIKRNEYGQFIINKAYAYHLDTILFANEMNSCHDLSDKMHYDFLFYILDKRKRYSKWDKKEKVDELIIEMAHLFNVSLNRAKEMISLMTDSQIEELKELLDKGGNNKGV